MKNILAKPYDLLESKLFKYLYVFGGSVFAFVFLWIFEPYGLYNLNLISAKILAIGLYIGVAMILVFIQIFLLQDIVIKKHTVIKTIAWILLSTLIVGTSSSIINAYLYNDGQFYLKSFFFFQGVILSINIIPVTLFVLIHYNITLKKRLKTASSINSSIVNKTELELNHKPLVLNSENKNEGLTIEVDSLICISSVDNYIEITYFKNNVPEKVLLRYTLSGVEKDNTNVFEIFRCHKSYIVNKNKISSIKGNAAGYQLILKGHEKPIPVSRKWNKNIHAIAT